MDFKACDSPSAADCMSLRPKSRLSVWDNSEGTIPGTGLDFRTSCFLRHWERARRAAPDHAFDAHELALSMAKTMPRMASGFTRAVLMTKW